MKVTKHNLQPPSLADIAVVVDRGLKSNFAFASASVVECPDLRREPFSLAAEGLVGDEKIADIGGQPNLFPTPKLSIRYDLMQLAEHMELLHTDGMLLGAGAGPFYDIGVNSELAPNIRWTALTKEEKCTVQNLTRYARIMEDGSVLCERSPTTNCALMMNLYGSQGKRGPVLRVTARKRTGAKNLTDCIRFALREHFGPNNPISLGGVFVVKKGTVKFHIMPDFPPNDQMPFKDPKQLNDWLTYHNFEAPITCLTVMHTSDLVDETGKTLGLRMEHTHCFAPDNGNRGGHYHYDIQDDGEDDDIEYEAYLNTAKMIYRIDQPETTLDKDLHD